jgi:hypothetical protein
MKLILLGLASVICGGIALMPLLVQPDPDSAPLFAHVTKNRASDLIALESKAVVSVNDTASTPEKCSETAMIMVLWSALARMRGGRRDGLSIALRRGSAAHLVVGGMVAATCAGSSTRSCGWATCG